MKDKKLIRVPIIPYIYIGMDIFNGTLEEIADKVLNIKQQLKEEHKLLSEKLKGIKSEPLVPFSDYVEIKLNIETDCDNYANLYMNVFRYETDKEVEKRLEDNTKRNISAKQKAKKRKESLEKRERSNYERLKKKFENK